MNFGGYGKNLHIGKGPVKLNARHSAHASGSILSLAVIVKDCIYLSKTILDVSAIDKNVENAGWKEIAFEIHPLEGAVIHKS